MSCEIPREISEYLEIVESKRFAVCPEQIALAKMIRKIFATENLIYNEEQAERYFGLQKYFSFDLFPWEKFITALWLCLYREDGEPRFRTVVCFVGRGAGKDGLISFDSACLISPYNPVPFYNVEICANNEEQAMTPCKDLAEVLDEPKQKQKLAKHYYHTKELIQGRKNRGIMRGRTNNPKGKDGLRPGAIIFNEVHQYENYDNINVFTTALGKRAQPRIGVFSSNGDVSDGPYDDYDAICKAILFEGQPDNGTLPFICRLASVDDVEDPEKWCMANPSLPYLPHLMSEIHDEFQKWKLHPEQNGSFITKRMGIRSGAKEIAVTTYEKIKATNIPLPDLAGMSCTVGVDYAEINDFAAVNLHFKKGTQRFDISNSWLCLQSRDIKRIRAPWQAWEQMGLLTVVDDVSINPDLLAEYIAQAMERYNVTTLAMDLFRWTLVSNSMKKIGFDAQDKERVKLVRPSDIMKIEPVIQETFDRGDFVWGDNPVLRWGCNNTKRVKSGRSFGVDTGNFIYAKIEPKSRKTDPWMALVASMIVEDRIEQNTMADISEIGVFTF